MTSMPKGRLARWNRHVSTNITPIMLAAENPSPIAKSHQKPRPGGDGLTSRTNTGVTTSPR